MACQRCDPSFPPIVKLDDDLFWDSDNDLSFYISDDAGGLEMSRGHHAGKPLREVPECYLCYNAMVNTYQWLLQPAQDYLKGLRRLEEKLGIARKAIPVYGAATYEPWYANAGSHLMEFGRYEGDMLRNIPLEYLLWTRADFSYECYSSEMGQRHLTALDTYIAGLERYLKSLAEDQPFLAFEITMRGSKRKVCYVASGYTGPTSEGQINFTYEKLKNAPKPSVVVSALTQTLFANINALTPSQMEALTASNNLGGV